MTPILAVALFVWSFVAILAAGNSQPLFWTLIFATIGVAALSA